MFFLSVSHSFLAFALVPHVVYDTATQPVVEFQMREGSLFEESETEPTGLAIKIIMTF